MPGHSLDLLLHGHLCPNFRNPPGGEDDIEFVLRYWVTCDHEGECLDEDTCPLLPWLEPRLRKGNSYDSTVG